MCDLGWQHGAGCRLRRRRGGSAHAAVTRVHMGLARGSHAIPENEALACVAHVPQNSPNDGVNDGEPRLALEAVVLVDQAVFCKPGFDQYTRNSLCATARSASRNVPAHLQLTQLCSIRFLTIVMLHI